MVLLKLLIDGYTLSRTLQANGPSELQLEAFFNRFGPSAQKAYLYAANPGIYQQGLLAEIGGITYENVQAIVREAGISSELSHQIVLISPGPYRHIPDITIPTRFIYEGIRDTLSKQKLADSARLYELFLSTPFTRGSAGYILEDNIHLLLSKGGE
jgi:hypothetical protein